MARTRNTHTRYRTPMLALSEPIVSRPLRDRSRLLVGDLSSIFGIELIEQAPRASHEDLVAFMDRVARQPAHSAPVHAPAPAPVASRVEPSQGSAEDPRDVPAAVAAWKALPDGAQVTCARGHKWTAKRSGGRLTFGQIKPSGRAGHDVEQPWFPLIMARLPVLPVPFIGEPDPQQGAPAAPVHAPLAPVTIRPAKVQPTIPATAPKSRHCPAGCGSASGPGYGGNGLAAYGSSYTHWRSGYRASCWALWLGE